MGGRKIANPQVESWVVRKGSYSRGSAVMREAQMEGERDVIAPWRSVSWSARRWRRCADAGKEGDETRRDCEEIPEGSGRCRLALRTQTLRIMPSVWPPDGLRSAALVTWTGLGIFKSLRQTALVPFDSSECSDGVCGATATEIDLFGILVCLLATL